jgi:iron(III) transport system ATP-binding protein
MLKVNTISFEYHKNKTVLEEMSFSLKQGEHLCVMGESGCGKSTLLKAVYGLLDLKKGSIFWNDKEILGPAFHLVPGVDNFKYVAQDFDLMPYTSVSENIAKFLSRSNPEALKKRTQELLEVIEMTAFANVKVKNLSGGQQQRVAIARALANEPTLLLLDEPFGQIDNFKKNSLRRNLFGYLKEKNIGCIIATHDKSDALSFADTLIVLKDKKILANNSPSEIYKNPKEKYIAALFDDVNEISKDNKTFLVYPHQLKIEDDAKILEGFYQIKATVLKTYFKGSYWLIEADFGHQKVFVNHLYDLEISKKVSLFFDVNSKKAPAF